MTTVIKNADWVVAWDGSQHVYRQNADVAFDGDTLTFVGGTYAGEADEVIDGVGLMVIPGFVDIHSHPATETSYRGLREDHGVQNMYMTGLFERSAALDISDPDLNRAGLVVSLCELLKSGVTSLCDIGLVEFDGWVDIHEQAGLRSFLAPGFASARWKLENDHVLGFDWDEQRGRDGMDRALRLIDSLKGHPSGRLSGVVSPLQIENCSDDLLRDSFDAAQERSIPYTLHISQSVNEFQEMIRRHGRTPVSHANDLGILSPNSILGHCLFLDTHSWIRWWTKEDLKQLADNGASVAHCPTPFSRYGHIMESFGDYVRAGVNMGIGTDTAPHNMLEEIRKTATFARIASRDIRNVSTNMLFHAATVGGSKALMRDDLGRLAEGCKADFVIVDLDHPYMQPARDPLQSLIYHAADRAVKDVWIAGRQVVQDGKVLTLDHAAAAAKLTEAQARMMERTPQFDYAGRTTDELSPICLPVE